MQHKINQTGFAIALAWPETWCKQAGAWYDGLMSGLGFNNNHYYKVGHSAVVLVEIKTGVCHYFDFGRYHAPFQHGRVREAETDHDLKINTKAIIHEDVQITNYAEILSEIYFNPSCHGSGILMASYCNINFEKTFMQAKQIQKRSPIPYGPFKIDGTNCSRFVNTVVLSGKPKWFCRLLLYYQKIRSPIPVGNVRALDNFLCLSPETELLKMYVPNYLTANQCTMDAANLHKTLSAPIKPELIHSEVQWLSGEGAGSWFLIEKLNENYAITRFSPEGKIECEGIFYQSGSTVFNINEKYEFTYLSHCSEVTIIQNGIKYQFKLKKVGV